MSEIADVFPNVKEFKLNWPLFLSGIIFEEEIIKKLKVKKKTRNSPLCLNCLFNLFTVEKISASKYAMKGQRGRLDYQSNNYIPCET